MKEEVLTELHRELSVRRQVYPRWVASGKLSQKVADQRIAAIAWAIGYIEGYGGVVESGQSEQLELLGGAGSTLDTGGRW